MASVTSRFQLGTDLDPGSNPPRLDTEADIERAVTAVEAAPKDFFVERDGRRFAGTHLIIDLFGAERLDDQAIVERALRDCVAAAGASLLHIHLHRFALNGGISGVAVLAESHISVHTWPERAYAAFDIFMCGETAPERAVEVLRQAFRPARLAVEEYLRGMVEERALDRTG